MTALTTRLALGVLLSGLAGCGALRPLPPPVTPYDYKDRHPIALSEAPYVLDVFPKNIGGRMDTQTHDRLLSFARKYAQFGSGPVVMAVPSGATGAGIFARQAGSVSRTLAAAGVGSVKVTDYPVVDATLAAPIRLSFNGLKAKVANRCGLWPRDLASGTSLDGWQNESYWNFGCATQNMVATQTADPRDLVSPRGETPADIEMRMRGILKVRQGADPATTWSGKGGSISNVGG